MQYTTCVSGWAILAVRLHLLVIVGYLALALLGQEPACRAGWVTLRQAQGRLCQVLHFSQMFAASGCPCRGKSWMASWGQAARHTPQPKQRVGSMYTLASAEE